MRAIGVRAPGNMRAEIRAQSGEDGADGPGGFRASLSGDGRSDLRAGDARLASLVLEGGLRDQNSGSLSRGRQRASGTGDSDGGAVGPARRDAGDGGPSFDEEVDPGGYAWWYVDAISRDRQYGVAIIAFIGSVFSPYYAWSGRKDPLNHCAVNIALYGPRGGLWAMTERRRAAVARGRDSLTIGPTTARWEGGKLIFDIDERASPVPRRMRGRVEVRPAAINPRTFVLETRGGHRWRPIAPSADVAVDMQEPSLHWRGSGYVDENAGREPLEVRILFLDLVPGPGAGRCNYPLRRPAKARSATLSCALVRSERLRQPSYAPARCGPAFDTLAPHACDARGRREGLCCSRA